MFLLIGEKGDLYQEKVGGSFVEHPTEEIVAKFSTEVKAKEYVRKSRLKNPHRRSFSGTYPFRRSSLLSGYNSCRIEEEEPKLEPVIDPEL